MQEYTNFYLSKNTILGSHTEDYQRQLKELMYGGVREIFAAENPLLKCRERLAGAVVSFAEWKVLCLKPDEKLQLPKDDARRSPFVSAELYHHIRQYAQHNDELTKIIADDENLPDNALIDWANGRSVLYMYLMNCMNVVRVDVNDCDPAAVTKGDWFRPFVKSMLIWKEDVYRSKIGLPSLLRGDLAWRHSTFLTYVLDGVPDPLSHWESVHQLKHAYVS